MPTNQIKSDLRTLREGETITFSYTPPSESTPVRTVTATVYEVDTEAGHNTQFDVYLADSDSDDRWAIVNPNGADDVRVDYGEYNPDDGQYYWEGVGDVESLSIAEN